MPLTGREALGVYEPFQVGTRVYVTLPDARRVAFLNKMDLVENHGAPRRLARSILASNETRVERVVLGSLKKNTYAVLLGDKS